MRFGQLLAALRKSIRSLKVDLARSEKFAKQLQKDEERAIKEGGGAEDERQQVHDGGGERHA
eukprot:3729089-Prorocentrum_lima.AAC.1